MRRASNRQGASRQRFRGVHATAFGVWLALVAVGTCFESDNVQTSVDKPPPKTTLRRLPPIGNSQIAVAETSIPSDQFNVQPASAQMVLASGDVRYDGVSEPGLYFGYDRGFVIGADQAFGDQDVDFLMRVNSWFHFRHTLFGSNGPNPNQNRFSFERLRLAFGGHVYSPDLQYFFQLDGNSDRSTETVFLDYFVKYDFGHEWLGWDSKRLGVKFGKWKVPFSRARKETGKHLQFTDRSSAGVFFDLNRSFGLGMYGQFESSMSPIHYETAIFDGFRTGSDSTSRSSDEMDNNFGWSIRMHSDPVGQFGGDGEPDLSWHCAPALRLGSGLAYTRVDAGGTNEFTRQRAVDSGVPLSSLLMPLGVNAYDIWFYTADAHFKYHGVSVIAEYYWRYVTQFRGADVPDLADDGFNLQGGYFIVPHKLEILARWSRIFGNSGTLSVVNESSDEVAAGIAWYIRGQNAKVILDVSHFNGVPVNSARLDLRPADIGWLLRTQFQLVF